MSPRNRLQPNPQIAEEAAEWFIEFRAGDVDQAGRRTFESWVRSSPEHLRAYLEFAAIWTEADSIDAQGEIDVSALIASAQSDRNVVRLEHPDHKQAPHAREVTSKGSRKLALAAAVLIVIASGAVLSYLRWYAAQMYSTSVGEQRSIRLSDGSTVELNSRSSVRVRINEQNIRTVDLLEGQAIFDVAKDPARPFIVRSDAAQVRAVGTRFDVNRKRAGTIVTVIEGKVAVSAQGVFQEAAEAADGASKAIGHRPRSTGHSDAASSGSTAIYLSAGEQLSLAPKAAGIPRRADIAVAIAWTQRQLVLQAAPLNEVAEEFNRYSTRKLTVDDTATEPLRLSGVFATDPDFLLRYLRARPDITVVEGDTEILIVHRN